MPNNPDIPNYGREQHIDESGPRDRNPLSGYEGVLKRSERDKAAAKKPNNGTIEGNKTTPPLGDEPH